MNLFIAVLPYNHMIFSECAESLFKNSIDLINKGYMITPLFNSGAYIDLARDMAVKLFLETDCTDLIFIDADLKFDSDSISKLLKHDKEIVTGIYPYKRDVLDFPVNLIYDENDNCKDEETGLVSVDMATTGFMRIKRSVFSDIIEHYKMNPDNDGMYHFFDTGMRFNDNKWYGEDIYFFKRFLDMGKKIWSAPDINFSHYAVKEYSGNYHNYLMSRAVDVNS
jgi:hypothetical protein